jgi:hypothetical protein
VALVLTGQADLESTQKWGAIDAAGKMVIPAQFNKYPYPDNFSEGLARVSLTAPDGSSRPVYIDPTGRFVLDFKKPMQPAAEAKKP